MTTVTVQALRLEFLSKNGLPTPAIDYTDVIFTYEGDVASLEYSVVGSVSNGLEEIALENQPFSIQTSDGLSLGTPAFSWLGEFEWPAESQQRNSTILEFFVGDFDLTNGGDYSFYIALSGDALPTGITSITSFATWYGDATISAASPSPLSFAGLDTLLTVSEDDTVLLPDGGVSFNAGAGNDAITGGNGADTLTGGDGDDTFFSSLGNDVFLGGSGNNTANYSTASDAVIVDLTGGTAIGADGQDTLTDISNAVGSTGDDILLGNDLANTLVGLDGADIIRGFDGLDTLQGMDGDDRLFGGIGEDVMDGGDGDDYMEGEADADDMQGGAGNDIMKGGGGDDLMAGGDGDDNLRGGNASDHLSGDAGEDSLFGGRSSDVLKGGADDDALRGDEGADLLNGEGGDDNLYGGIGKDTFEFFDTVDVGRDNIKDWEKGMDVIDLRDFGFTDFNQVLAISVDQGSNLKIDIGLLAGANAEGTGARILIDNYSLALFDADDVLINDLLVV